MTRRRDTDAPRGPLRPADLADGQPSLLDAKALAKMLSCSTRHIYRLCETNLMPRPTKLGRLNRWSKRAILAWIDAGCPDCRKGADDE